MITDFFQKTIFLTVPTSSVLDRTEIEAELQPSRQPADEGVVRVSVFGTPSPGTVSVHGISGGSEDVATYTFSSAGTHSLVGTKLFTSLSTITVTGPTSGEIALDVSYQSGEPILQEVPGLTVSGMTQTKPEHKAGYLLNARFGEKTIGDHDLMVMYNPLFKAGYFVYDGKKKYKIEFVPVPSHFGHVVCDISFQKAYEGYPLL